MNIRNACNNPGSIPAGDVGKIFDFGVRVLRHLLSRLHVDVKDFHLQNDIDKNINKNINKNGNGNVNINGDVNINIEVFIINGIGTHIYLANGMHLFFGLNPNIENLAKDDKTKGKPAEFKENAVDYAFGFAVQNEDFTGRSKECIYIDSTLVNHEKWSFFKLPSVTSDSDISLLDMETLAAKCVSMLGKYTG